VLEENKKSIQGISSNRKWDWLDGSQHERGKSYTCQKKSNPNQMRQTSIKREMTIKRMRCPDMRLKSPEIVDFAIYKKTFVPWRNFR